MRLVHARADRADRAEARPHLRRAQRFERGVDPAFLEDGLQIATATGDRAGRRRRRRRWSSAGTPPMPRQDRRLRSGALRGPGRRRRARGPAAGDPAAARLHRDARRRPGGSRCRHGVATWTAPADIVEEVVRIEGIDKVPSTPLPRAPGVAQPTATPEQLIERERAARRGGARAQRGGDLELHRRGRGGAVRRRGLDARQSDQRGDEGDAALAAARPARRGARAMRRAARRACACSRSAGAIWTTASGRRSGLVLAGDRDRAALARGQGGGGSTPMTPRPRRWRSSPPPARRSTICRCSAGASAVYHPGQSGRLCLGPKNVLAEFGALHPRIARAFDLDGPVVAAEIFLDAIPQKRGGTAICAAPMRRRRCRR